MTLYLNTRPVLDLRLGYEGAIPHPRNAPAGGVQDGPRRDATLSAERLTRFVVADDDGDDMVRNQLRDRLEDDGFEVVAVAGDADEALASTCRDRPDVVLSDLRMPGGSGLTLLDRLHRSGVQVPVGLTAHDDPGLSRRALDSGAAAFVTKGCSADAICSNLLEAAARRCGPAPVTSRLPVAPPTAPEKGAGHAQIW
jgi:DNA-binding NarL/FixJ family response regulator